MSATKQISGGKGVKIVVPKPDHTFELAEDLINGLLNDPDIKNRSVVFIAVAGAYRKGKSFLLGFFLRYLYHTYEQNLSDDNWMGAEDEPMRGFEWRGGSDRNTTGLLIWSHPFKATLENGEKVAIFLMDSQGTFDSESTIRENATIFALSTMVSSVLLYNLSQNIEEDDLQHLQLFTDYGRVALEKTEEKPFQHLLFLVRDWGVAYEYPYGAEGGQMLMDKILEIDEDQHEELKTLRREIRACFSKLSCFLLPHPGLKVASSKTFQGKLVDIEQEFLGQIKVLVSSLLSIKNLEPKVLSGQKIVVKDLLHYLKAYMVAFNGSDLPVPQTILEATAQANNLSAVEDAREVYETLMEEVVGGSTAYMPTDRLDEEHHRAIDKAVHSFESKKKLGGKEKSDHYKELLLQDLAEEYEKLRAQNESKNLLNVVFTGLLFAGALIVGIVLSILANTIGLRQLELIGQAISLASLCSLAIWLYSRFTGQMRAASAILDKLANFVRVKVFKNMTPAISLPAVALAMKKE